MKLYYKYNKNKKNKNRLFTAKKYWKRIFLQ